MSEKANILLAVFLCLLGFQGQVLIVGGYRGGFYEKLPSCPMESMPAGSKTNPLLPKAKPISYDGAASGVTELRRGGKPCTAATTAAERRENM